MPPFRKELSTGWWPRKTTTRFYPSLFCSSKLRIFMQEFPSNSRKAAQARTDEPKKLERVTSAEAVRRKRGLGRQMRDTFIAGNPKIAIEYMMVEVVVPAIKETVAEALQSGIEKLIYGESHKPRRGSSPTPLGYTNVPRVNYQSQYGASPPRSNQTSMLSRRARGRHDFDEIVIQSRQEANDVLDQMYDILSRHNSVTVADLYELTGIQASHMDYKWGWTDLRGSKASKLRSGGYLLDLPDPQPLN